MRLGAGLPVWGCLVLGLCASGGADLALAGQSGPKAARFEELFQQWKNLLGQLRDLRDQYRTASPARHTELEERYDRLLRQGDRMLARLAAAAEEALLEAPEAPAAASELLVEIIRARCFSDDYEEAFRLARLLIERGYHHRALLGWGGVAAFALCQFDLARQWLQQADQRTAFTTIDPQFQELAKLALRQLGPSKDGWSYQEAWQREQAIRAAEAKADASPETWLPRVVLKTSKGEIELELFENEAPNTVANFIWLVEAGLYNGAIFHRVVGQTAAQAAATRAVGYTIPCECYQPNYRRHFRGSLTMGLPQNGRDKGSSEFYLTFLPLHQLDGHNTCFGRVVRGMEVLSKLQRILPERLDTIEPDQIIEAKVVRKRNHPYEPKKLPLAKP